MNVVTMEDMLPPRNRFLLHTISRGIVVQKHNKFYMIIAFCNCQIITVNYMVGLGTKRSRDNMKISYNRLRKLLIDKGMKKSDLRKVANVSSSSLEKLGRAKISLQM